jgi:hypothetical protein
LSAEACLAPPRHRGFACGFPCPSALELAFEPGFGTCRSEDLLAREIQGLCTHGPEVVPKVVDPSFELAHSSRVNGLSPERATLLDRLVEIVSNRRHPLQRLSAARGD